MKVGKVTIGGDAPVSVQSMTTTKTTDIYATLHQIRNLEVAGCDIVRVTVPDEASAEALPEIKAGISIPLVADIHFNYRIALLALDAGVDKLRINPGNIAARSASALWSRGVRAGVRSGRCQQRVARQDILERTAGRPRAAWSSPRSALRDPRAQEFPGYRRLAQSSHVPRMIGPTADCRRARLPAPSGRHGGGPVEAGTIKSCAGLGPC